MVEIAALTRAAEYPTWNIEFPRFPSIFCGSLSDIGYSK
jgi:hypothetical protein